MESSLKRFGRPIPMKTNGSAVKLDGTGSTIENMAMLMNRTESRVSG